MIRHTLTKVKPFQKVTTSSQTTYFLFVKANVCPKVVRPTKSMFHSCYTFEIGDINLSGMKMCSNRLLVLISAT